MHYTVIIIYTSAQKKIITIEDRIFLNVVTNTQSDMNMTRGFHCVSIQSQNNGHICVCIYILLP